MRPALCALALLLPTILSAAEPEAPLPRGASARLGSPRNLLSESNRQETIQQILYSADGRLLAVAESRGPIVLWDVATGKELRRFARPDLPFHSMLATEDRSIALSPDGKLLAYGDGGLVVAATDTGKKLHTFAKGKVPIRAVAFAPDGKRLAGAGSLALSLIASSLPPADAFPEVRTWDLATGKELARGTGESVTLPLRGLVFRTADQVLALVEVQSATTSFADLLTRKTVARSEPLGDRSDAIVWAMCSAVSADGSLLAISGTKTIHIIELCTGKTVLHLDSADRALHQIRFAPDGWHLAGVSRDDTIHEWDLSTGKKVSRLPQKPEGAVAVAYAPDGRSLAVGCADGTVVLWPLVARSVEAKRLSAEDRDRAWSDLAGADAARALQAVATLAADPQTPGFLEERLKPVPLEVPAEVKELLADLASDRFAKRQAASQALENFGWAAEPALRQALTDKPALEVQRRIEELLARLERRSSPDEVRYLRAVRLLEQIASPEARGLLAALADGAPTALRTQDAQAARDRAHRRP